MQWLIDVNEAHIVSESSQSQLIKERPAWTVDYVVSHDQSDDTLAHYALLLYCDLMTFQIAIKDSKWKKSMDEEIRCIEKNNTWELSKLPKRQQSIGC